MAAVVIVVAGLKAASSFFVPLLLAFFIASVSFPITAFLRDRKCPLFLAVLITVIVDFAFLAGIVVISAILATDLAEASRMDSYSQRMYQVVMQWADQLEELGVENVRADFEKFFKPDTLLEMVDPVTSLGVFTAAGGLLTKLLSTSFVIFILLIFMLNEARMFGRRFQAIFEARGPNLQSMLTATKDIQKYLGIKTLVSLATGILAGLLCWGVGVEFPFLWGILAFGLNYIPAVGSVIAGIPPVLIALLMHDGKTALIMAAGYIAINGFLGNFVEPALLGKRFGLSTVVIVISVLFWGWVWGPVGMLLSVPLTMLLKVAVDNSYELRWLGVAISKGKDKEHDHEERQILAEVVRPNEEVKAQNSQDVAEGEARG
ncbi:AI-2E family transporter [Persicirhabdus sediminis]|nr:AI-2E family transporter [Persicirhabdus sediminis]